MLTHTIRVGDKAEIAYQVEQSADGAFVRTAKTVISYEGKPIGPIVSLSIGLSGSELLARMTLEIVRLPAAKHFPEAFIVYMEEHGFRVAVIDPNDYAPKG